MALVAAAGHALRGDAVALAAGGRLHEREEVEADGLLDLRRALDLDVAAVPERGDVRAVRRLDRVVARGRGPVERVVDAREQAARVRPRRPVVGDGLGHAERLARPQVREQEHLGAVALGVGLDRDGHARLDPVVHAAGQLEPAVHGREPQGRAGPVRARDHWPQHALGEALAAARVLGARARRVGDELGARWRSGPGRRARRPRSRARRGGGRPARRAGASGSGCGRCARP